MSLPIRAMCPVWVVRTTRELEKRNFILVSGLDEKQVRDWYEGSTFLDAMGAVKKIERVLGIFAHQPLSYIRI